jgi:hypothetical protein
MLAAVNEVDYILDDIENSIRASVDENDMTFNDYSFLVIG